jgi:hypothetical protein
MVAALLQRVGELGGGVEIVGVGLEDLAPDGFRLRPAMIAAKQRAEAEQGGAVGGIQAQGAASAAQAAARAGVRRFVQVSAIGADAASKSAYARTMAEAERMAKHLPHASFEVIEDCGHMAPLEKPAELMAILGGWVSKSGL